MTKLSSPQSPDGIAVIITAAGSSSRMGGKIKKELLPLGKGTVLSACVKAFLDISCKNIIITIPADGRQQALQGLESLNQTANIEFVHGGSTRQKSVYNALEYLSKKTQQPDLVLIHDGARPFVSKKLILDVIDAASKYEASVPGITPTDTIKSIDKDGFIESHLVRSSLTAVQTPQGFSFTKLWQAHKQAAADKKEYTDDSEIWSYLYGKVKVVPGDVKNFKITYPGDLEKIVSLEKEKGAL